MTKGRLLFPDRTASPQIDVLVLSGAYPTRLVHKKLYLSSGVVAAFECKNTLTAEHVGSALRTSAFLKSRVPRRTGTLQEELRVPLVYGLLAHSHSWKAPASAPIDNVDRALTAGFPEVARPADMLDVICVADLAAWTLSQFTECPWFYEDGYENYGGREAYRPMAR